MGNAPTPPPDASGRFMIIRYFNATDTHRMRIHLSPFSLTGWTGAQQAGATVDYGYAGGTPAPTEGTVAATFAALVNTFKSGYHTGWTFLLDQLYQVVSGVPTLVPVPPNPTQIIGTNASAPSTLDRYTATVYNFRTTSGHRARVEYIGATGAATGTAASLTAAHPVAGYLGGAATGVRAHDGTPLLLPCHQTYPQLKKLRRKMGQA